TSQIEVRVTKVFYDSTVSKILNLVENASSQKSKAENFITKFAKYYTPAVVAVALLLAIIPGAVTSDWSTWVYRALSFLVVSCPCALVISIPLSFFAGIGAASRYGILVKGSNYLEKFNKANTFVFDKTGTLTKGNFAVTKVSPESDRDNVLRLAAIAEQNSNHPIARSIVSAYGGQVDGGYTLTNVAGAGIVATNGDDTILCGNEKLMAQNGIEYVKEDGLGTVVYVAHNGKFIGSLLIADEIKEESKQVIGELNGMGCKTVMLTGDNEAIAASVANQIGLTGYKASLLPQNKVEEVENLLAAKDKDDVLCFVGDGINDAPVLMRSDIGIAMGGVGSDAAIEASDIVLMKDDLKGISLAKRIAKKTMAIVLENIWFSLIVKLAILVLSAFGITNMWVAVFGDVGVAVLAILNAIRVNSKYVKQPKTTA
ncbi:MAG: cadmium-translocating P-type ATPase, partial [Clostridiales bacterium]|nr:cadmium-translocating P-type ATPase [Clostridiales bacterium]